MGYMGYILAQNTKIVLKTARHPLDNPRDACHANNKTKFLPSFPAPAICPITGHPYITTTGRLPIPLNITMAISGRYHPIAGHIQISTASPYIFNRHPDMPWGRSSFYISLRRQRWPHPHHPLLIPGVPSFPGIVPIIIATIITIVIIILVAIIIVILVTVIISPVVMVFAITVIITPIIITIALGSGNGCN
jgi:hypothetical protein